MSPYSVLRELTRCKHKVSSTILFQCRWKQYTVMNASCTWNIERNSLQHMCELAFTEIQFKVLYAHAHWEVNNRETEKSVVLTSGQNVRDDVPCGSASNNTPNDKDVGLLVCNTAARSILRCLSCVNVQQKSLK